MFSKKKERMYRGCTEGTGLKQWNARGKAKLCNQSGPRGKNVIG